MYKCLKNIVFILKYCNLLSFLSTLLFFLSCGQIFYYSFIHTYPQVVDSFIHTMQLLNFICLFVYRYLFRGSLYGNKFEPDMGRSS